MPNEERGRLDSAIDRAVRGMMQVDPPPGLRHRVANRIEASTRRTWMVPAFAAVAAAVVLILAIVLLRTPQVAPSPEPAVVRAPPATPAEPPPQAAVATTRPESAVAPAAEPPPQARSERPGAEAIFGEPTGRVSAANVRPEKDETPKPINVKLDLTFTDHAASGEPIRKLVSMVVADRGVGTIRGGTRSEEGVQINVDARPQILSSGAIRLMLALEYPRALSNHTAAGSSTLNEQLTTIVQPGKPVVISQAADPTSDRRITVEVRASLIK